LFYYSLPWRTWRLAADFECLAFAWDAVMHTSCAPSCRRASYACLCFGKQVCHAKPALDLGDDFDLLAQGPSQFESESDGRYLFYHADALVDGSLWTTKSLRHKGLTSDVKHFCHAKVRLTFTHSAGLGLNQ